MICDAVGPSILTDDDLGRYRCKLPAGHDGAHRGGCSMIYPLPECGCGHADSCRHPKTWDDDG